MYKPQMCFTNKEESNRDDSDDKNHNDDRQRSTDSSLYNIVNTVQHVYFASIKFSRVEHNREIEHTQIIGIARHHKFIGVEQQYFHNVICNILGNM